MPRMISGIAHPANHVTFEPGQNARFHATAVRFKHQKSIENKSKNANKNNLVPLQGRKTTEFPKKLRVHVGLLSFCAFDPSQKKRICRQAGAK